MLWHIPETLNMDYIIQTTAYTFSFTKYRLQHSHSFVNAFNHLRLSQVCCVQCISHLIIKSEENENYMAATCNVKYAPKIPIKKII